MVFCFGTNEVCTNEQGGSNRPFVGVRLNGPKVYVVASVRVLSVHVKRKRSIVSADKHVQKWKSIVDLRLYWELDGIFQTVQVCSERSQGAAPNYAKTAVHILRKTLGCVLKEASALFSSHSMLTLAAVTEMEAPIAVLWTCLQKYYRAVPMCIIKSESRRPKTMHQAIKFYTSHYRGCSCEINLKTL